MPKFGDTPDHSLSSLCATCRHAQNVSGLRLNDTFTLCRIHGMDAIRIQQPVTKCSEYDDKRDTPLWQMEKIAWRFSVDDRRKTAGFSGETGKFVTPQQFKERVKQGKEIEDD